MRPHPSCPRPLFLFRSPSWVEMLRERASAPDRTMDRDHRRFDRHTPVSIQMPDSLIEQLSKDVSLLASLVLHSARKQPRPRRLRRCRQTDRSTALWHMTHLGEPQSAAGVPALVPGDRADQPRLAGMDGLLKKGLGKTGDHMNVPVDVASLVQQPAQVAGLRGSRRRRRWDRYRAFGRRRGIMRDNRWTLSTWWILTTSEGSGRTPLPHQLKTPRAHY